MGRDHISRSNVFPSLPYDRDILNLTLEVGDGTDVSKLMNKINDFKEVKEIVYFEKHIRIRPLFDYANYTLPKYEKMTSQVLKEVFDIPEAGADFIIKSLAKYVASSDTLHSSTKKKLLSVLGIKND